MSAHSYKLSFKTKVILQNCLHIYLYLRVSSSKYLPKLSDVFGKGVLTKEQETNLLELLSFVKEHSKKTNETDLIDLLYELANNEIHLSDLDLAHLFGAVSTVNYLLFSHLDELLVMLPLKYCDSYREMALKVSDAHKVKGIGGLSDVGRNIYDLYKFFAKEHHVNINPNPSFRTVMYDGVVIKYGDGQIPEKIQMHS